MEKAKLAWVTKQNPKPKQSRLPVDARLHAERDTDAS